LKTTSTFLWQLIHSLSSNEKLFFKRNFTAARSPAQKIYFKLFAAIASQKEYNEEALIKKLHPVITKKNLASQKHYLQQLVCNAVIEYDSRNNIGQEIYDQIQLIRIYRKKGLLDEAHAIWKKAVKKARQTESFALLNLLKTEFEKMILFSSLHTRYDELHALFKTNAISYLEYADLISLRDIYAETILLKRKAHFDIDAPLKIKITALLEQVEKYKSAVDSPSFWFRHYYYTSKATLCYLLNDIPTSLVLLKEVLPQWKKNTSFISTNGEYYVELLYMINYAGILQGQYIYVTNSFNDKCNELIEEPVQRANFEAIKYLALNKIYNKTAHYDEVEKLLLFMKAKYQQWEPLLNADMNRTVNLSLGIASFALEQYDNALYFTKRAITYYKDGTREEHLSVAQVLLLLITYCLNSPRLFDAQYRTTYTYFYKRKMKHPFETALIQCLHRSFYLKDNKSKIQEYQKALQVFEENKEDVVQQMTFSIFNYPGWLQSKAQRITYRRYVEMKVTETANR
jgi:hypothetical protein